MVTGFLQLNNQCVFSSSQRKFPIFCKLSAAVKYIRSGIEAVITGRTRNAFGLIAHESSNLSHSAKRL